jgi:hypothetical protein
MRRVFAHDFVSYKKGALGSQPQVIKLSSRLPTAESGAKHQKSINQ